MAFVPALAYASTAVSVVGGLMKADATYRAGKQEAANAMTEADMTEAATRQADAEARAQIARTRIEQRAFTGSQRATIAASGVVGTVGSPIDILGRTAALQELQIQDQARRASTEYSAGFARARQIRVGGAAAFAGAKAASTGDLLSTAASAANSYLGYRDQFAKKSLVPAK